MNRIFRSGDRIFKIPENSSEEDISSILSSISSPEGPATELGKPLQAAMPKPAPVNAEPTPKKIIEPAQELKKPLNLGALSEKYESSVRGSSAIGKDSTGGASYGRYQISEAQKTLKDFLGFAKDNSPDVYSVLAPLEKTAKDISGKFARAWKSLASQGKLSDLEHEFIKKTHYDAAIDSLSKNGIDLSKRSDIMQDVIWSTSVQHGAAGATDIISGIPKINSLSDSDLINKIYNERAKQFPSATPKERAAVKVRLKKERAEALSALKTEQRRKLMISSGEGNGENPRG